MNKTSLTLPPDYARWLTSLKQRIRGARQRALLAANDEQIRLYHDIGRDILDRLIGQQTADQLPWFHIVSGVAWLGEVPPRPLAEIDAELKGVTDRILAMIGGLTK